MSIGTKKIFIIERDRTLVYVYRIFLEEIGHKCVGSAKNIEEARKLMSAIDSVDIVLMDVDSAGEIEDCVKFSEELFNNYNILVLYILSEFSQKNLVGLMSSSFYGYLRLPMQTDVMKLSIEFAVKKFEYEQKHFVEHKVLDNINLGVVIFRLNGEIVFSNESANKNFGVRVGGNVRDYLYDKFFSVDNVFINSILGTHFKDVVLEKEFEGKSFYYNLQFSVYNVKKRDPLIYCFISDISSKKSFSVIQSETNTSFRNILDNIDEGIFIIDRGFKLIDHNEISQIFFEEMFERELSLGMHLTDFFFFLSPDQQKEFTKSLLVAFRGVSRSLVRSFNFKEKSFYFRIKLIPLLKNESTGKYNLVTISIQNLTREKLLELRVNELETEVKPLFDSSFQRFYLCDLNYKIISFNKAAFDVILKEFNHKLKKGDSILNFIPKEVSIEDFKDYFTRTLNYEHVFFKIKIHSDTIGDYWNETHLDPVINSKGEIHEVLIWTIDITEQEKNVQALRESEERYSLIANGANDGLWDWDLKTNKVYLSPRWKALLGYSDDELPNEYGVRDKLLHPEDKERSEVILRKYFQGEINEYINEIRLRHKDGHYIWVLERGVALRDENGNIIRLAGSITDITKQKKIEQQLKDAYLQLMQERQMFIDADIVIFKMKVNKYPEITYITKNVKKILGYDSSEIISNKVNLYSLIHPEDVVAYKKNLVKLKISKNKSQQFKPIRFRTSSGNYIWVKSFVIITDRKEDAVDIQGHFMDVTEILEAKRILTERQKNLLEFISSSNDAIIGIDDKGIIIDFNKKSLAIFGLNADVDIKGEVIAKFLEKTEDNKTWDEIFEEANSRKGRLYIFRIGVKNNKDYLHLEVSVNPVHVNKTKVYYLILRDITERKKLEKEIIKNKARYEALVNAIPDLIFVVDYDGNYIDYTVDKSSPLYVEPKNIIGKNLKDFFPDENKYKEILEKIRDTIRTGILNIVTYEMDSRMGRRKFEARISKMDDKRILSIVRDITDPEIK